MKKVQTLLLTVGVLAVLIGNGPIPASAQQQPLLGCVKPGTQLLRILSAGEGCKNNETPLGFNDLPLLVALRGQNSKTLEASGAKFDRKSGRIRDVSTDWL